MRLESGFRHHNGLVGSGAAVLDDSGLAGRLGAVAQHYGVGLHGAPVVEAYFGGTVFRPALGNGNLHFGIVAPRADYGRSALAFGNAVFGLVESVARHSVLVGEPYGDFRDSYRRSIDTDAHLGRCGIVEGHLLGTESQSVEGAEGAVGGSVGDKVDRVLALEAFDMLRDIHGELLHLVARARGHGYLGNLLAVPGVVVIGAVEPYLHGELPVALGTQEKVEGGLVAPPGAFEGLQSLLCLLESAETEVLVSDDIAVGDGNGHAVVPDVPGVLLARDVRQVAGVSCRIVLIGVKSEYLEAFGGHLGAGVGVTVRCRRFPDAVLGIGVVSAYDNLAAFGNRGLVPLYGHGSHHCLPCESESAGRTVVEHIPLVVDLLEAAVGVVGAVGGRQRGTVLIGHHAPRVYQHSAAPPGAERAVAVCVAQ